MNTSVAQRRPLGQILISEGILSEDQLRIALLEQMKCNQPIGKLLVSLGFVTEATLRQALSESLGKQSIDLRNAVVDPQALKLVPRELAKRHHLLPLDYDAEHHRRQPLEQEQPLPALQVPQPVQRQDITREDRAEHHGHRHGDHKERVGAGAMISGEPPGEIDQDPRQETGFGNTHQHAQDVERLRAGGKHGAG